MLIFFPPQTSSVSVTGEMGHFRICCIERFPEKVAELCVGHLESGPVTPNWVSCKDK